MNKRFYRLMSLSVCVYGLILGTVTGCNDQKDATTKQQTVTVYSSVDQQFAETIFADFEKETGIKVNYVPDVEAQKTTGLLNRIRDEKKQPKCDVWWSSEVFSSVQLADEGLLQSYDSPAAADIAAEWKDKENRWTGMAARCRVLGYNTQRVKKEELPTSLEGLAYPKWAKRLAFADPHFGTTRGHFAALYVEWGEEKTNQWFKALKDGGAIKVPGNGAAVRAMLDGTADICLTDTDDIWVQQANKKPVDLIYINTTTGGSPMWIPCSVALIKDCPHAETGKKLVDYLVSKKVEEALAKSESQNISVRKSLREKLKQTGPAPTAVDYQKIADVLEKALKAAENILLK